MITRDQFNKLVEQWQRDTGYLSNIQKKFEHPDYKEITSHGMDVVPFILENIKNGKSGHWFVFLSEITGANPIRNGDNLKGLSIMEWPSWKECEDSWVKWGEDNNLI